MKKEQFACDCHVIHKEAVSRVLEKMPESQKFYDVANLYKLLSDSTRIKILWALSCEDMCVCDLAVILDMTKSAVSHQLKSLRLSGLVKYDKQGRVVYYSLADNHIRGILDEVKL